MVWDDDEKQYRKISNNETVKYHKIKSAPVIDGRSVSWHYRPGVGKAPGLRDPPDPVPYAEPCYRPPSNLSYSLANCPFISETSAGIVD